MVYTTLKTRSLFADLTYAKCFVISIKAEPQDTVSINFNYLDTRTNKTMPSKGLFTYDPKLPNEFLSQIDYLTNWKYYKGQNDLLLQYFGQSNGEIILERRDKSVAFVLTKSLENSTSSQELRDEAESIGLKSEKFTYIDNDNCKSER